MKTYVVRVRVVSAKWVKLRVKSDDIRTAMDKAKDKVSKKKKRNESVQVIDASLER